MAITRFEHYSHGFAKWIASGKGFIAAVISIVFWGVAGWPFHFSYAWENALTVYISVITFLMIFIMERAQQKELNAVHAKLNELILVNRLANNNLIKAEELTEDELKEVHKTHQQNAESSS